MAIGIRASFNKYVVLFLLCFIPFYAFAQPETKEPNVAGTFYPEDAGELRAMIQLYLDQAKEAAIQGKPFVLISPHAGYIYSGPVAAYGFAGLRGLSFDTVIILAPSHFFYFKGASMYAQGSFQTPFGDIRVDEAMCAALLNIDKDLLIDKPEYFQREHSLEVQLPFLQVVLQNGFKIVPIIVGDLSLKECEALAGSLAVVSKGKRVLVIASTDLSHYRPYAEALKYDHETIDFIKNFDIVGLWEAVSPVSWNVCGVRPLTIGLFYAQQQGAADIEILRYANSGDVTGERGRVVGYLSALLTKGQKDTPAGKEKPQEGAADMLTKEDKKELLKIARIAIETYLSTGDKKPFTIRLTSPGLNLKRGAFVTLHEKGSLRGCLGVFSSEQPLYQSVAGIAVDSSTRDYRFSPVKKDELKDIVIEISVLSEPELIDDWHKIRLGMDGVIIRKGFSSGVFLPQVASETGWDLETFLGQLCSQKAGLPYEAFKDPAAKIYTFQADVFSESDF